MEWGLEEQNKCYRFLKPGMKLSLSSVDNQQIKGIAATLIGFKPSAFLIVDVSQVGSEALGELTDGDLVIRGLSDSSFGHVIAFRSRFISRRMSRVSICSWRRLVILSLSHQGALSLQAVRAM